MDLMVDTYGTKIGSTGERITLSFPDSGIRRKEYPIRRINKIVILRPASLSTNAVQLALEHDVDIVYLGSFGKPIGRIFSSQPKGLASLRRAQLETSVSPEKSFETAKTIVKGKCDNQIDYLRHLAQKYQKDLNKEILQAQAVADGLDRLPFNNKSKEQLLGIEGYVADRYFEALKKLHSFPGRRPQGRDKFNSALNYAYGMLYNEVERACLYIGLDLYLGLYHSERYGKPALVLDLVEEFRVPVADSIVFPLFLEKKLGKTKHFEKIAPGQYQLSSEGKYIIVEAVLKRLNQTVSWREKRYALKAVIENQVQALARYFLGKETQYIPFDLKTVIPIPNHE